MARDRFDDGGSLDFQRMMYRKLSERYHTEQPYFLRVSGKKLLVSFCEIRCDNIGRYQMDSIEDLLC